MLREYIPKVEAAGDLNVYQIVLQELASRLNQGHTGAMHPALFYRHTLGIRLERIEGKIIVVEEKRDLVDVSPPIQVGDEVIAIDGKSVPDVMTHRRTIISSPNEQTFVKNLWIRDFPLRGPKDTSVFVTLNS
jgi:hypothetical protein